MLGVHETKSDLQNKSICLGPQATCSIYSPFQSRDLNNQSRSSSPSHLFEERTLLYNILRKTQFIKVTFSTHPHPPYIFTSNFKKFIFKTTGMGHYVAIILPKYRFSYHYCLFKFTFLPISQFC